MQLGWFVATFGVCSIFVQNAVLHLELECMLQFKTLMHAALDLSPEALLCAALDVSNSQSFHACSIVPEGARQALQPLTPADPTC